MVSKVNCYDTTRHDTTSYVFSVTTLISSRYSKGASSSSFLQVTHETWRDVTRQANIFYIPSMHTTGDWNKFKNWFEAINDDINIVQHIRAVLFFANCSDLLNNRNDNEYTDEHAAPAIRIHIFFNVGLSSYKFKTFAEQTSFIS